MLNLSAAFDLIDHNILINHLEHVVGLRGTVLKWWVGEFSSSSVPLEYGVPQGSILGPFLFSLFLLPLGLFFKHSMSYHLYADAIKIYLPSRSGGSSSHSSLLLCLEEVKCWLEQNRLQLIASKSEVIFLGQIRLTVT